MGMFGKLPLKTLIAIILVFTFFIVVASIVYSMIKAYMP